MTDSMGRRPDISNTFPLTVMLCAFDLIAKHKKNIIILKFPIFIITILAKENLIK
jgi:hypothetical protein